jgi:hypothetical protein
MSLESIKYWIGLNKALNKRGTQQWVLEYMHI